MFIQRSNAYISVEYSKKYFACVFEMYQCWLHFIGIYTYISNTIFGQCHDQIIFLKKWVSLAFRWNIEIIARFYQVVCLAIRSRDSGVCKSLLNYYMLFRLSLQLYLLQIWITYTNYIQYCTKVNTNFQKIKSFTLTLQVLIKSRLRYEALARASNLH